MSAVCGMLSAQCGQALISPPSQALSRSSLPMGPSARLTAVRACENSNGWHRSEHRPAFATAPLPRVSARRLRGRSHPRRVMIWPCDAWRNATIQASRSPRKKSSSDRLGRDGEDTSSMCAASALASMIWPKWSVMTTSLALTALGTRNDRFVYLRCSACYEVWAIPERRQRQREFATRMPRAVRYIGPKCRRLSPLRGERQ